jgi:putative AbiEii toxin of type IV toxin-antitoxin system
LSQSVVLPNNSRAITLDDEYAYVHLGRFIEAIHSKSYGDAISLGITIADARYRSFASAEDDDRISAKYITGSIAAQYSFRSTLRTQEVWVASAEISAGTDRFIIRPTSKRGAAGYSLSTPASPKTVAVLDRSSGFLFELNPLVLPPAGSAAVFTLQSIQAKIRDALNATKYLGPFRQPPLRRYPTRGSGPKDVGTQGEHTVTLLANESITRQRRPHLDEVSQWIARLGLGRRIEVPRVGTSDLFETNVTLADDKKFAIADLGYGLSQVLPVLTQCSFAEPGSTLLFEQPELHLHPLAAGKLTGVFCDTVRKGVTVIAETHSDDMIKSVLRAIRAGEISRKDVAFYKAKRTQGRTEIASVKIHTAGDVDEAWDRDVSAEILGGTGA